MCVDVGMKERERGETRKMCYVRIENRGSETSSCSKRKRRIKRCPESKSMDSQSTRSEKGLLVL